MPHTVARRRRRWLAVAVVTAWLALTTLALTHAHGHAAPTHRHCATCHWLHGAASVVPAVATVAPPRPTFASELAQALPEPRRVATRQLHLRGPPPV